MSFTLQPPQRTQHMSSSQQHHQIQVSNRQTLVGGGKRKKKKRTKVLNFSPRVTRFTDGLFGNSKFIRLYSSLKSNDVVLFAGRTSTPPNNKRYHAILRKHHEKFVNASSGIDRRAIVHTIREEATRKADPPGRFIAMRFGTTQWLGMNDEDVVKMIFKDLHNLSSSTSSKSSSSSRSVVATAAASEASFPQPRPVKIRQPTQKKKKKTKKKKTSNKSPNELQYQPTSTTTQISELAASTPHSAAVLTSCTDITKFFQLPEMAADRERLSDYNRLLMQNLELFEVTAADAATNSGGGGRRKVVGQLGVRCRHCGAASANNNNNKNPPSNPPEKKKQKKKRQKNVQSTSFPGRIEIAEFNVNVIGIKHLVGTGCPNIPPEIRKQLVEAWPNSRSQTHQRSDPLLGGYGIKRYFSKMAQLCGIVEVPQGFLKLAPRGGSSAGPPPPAAAAAAALPTAAATVMITETKPEKESSASLQFALQPMISKETKAPSDRPAPSPIRTSAPMVADGKAAPLKKKINPSPASVVVTSVSIVDDDESLGRVKKTTSSEQDELTAAAALAALGGGGVEQASMGFLLANDTNTVVVDYNHKSCSNSNGGGFRSSSSSSPKSHGSGLQMNNDGEDGFGTPLHSNRSGGGGSSSGRKRKRRQSQDDHVLVDHRQSHLDARPRCDHRFKLKKATPLLL